MSEQNVSIERQIGFTTNVYANTPDHVILEFNSDEIGKIKRMIRLAKSEDVVIKIRHYATDYLNNEKNHFGEYDEGPSYVMVYPDGDLFFSSQCDNNSTIQIESNKFSINDLINENG